MTELLVGTKKGLFVLEGKPGAPFAVRARAFAGEPVEYAVRDPRSGRVFASVTSPFYGPKIFFADDPAGEWGQAAGLALPTGGDAALERIWVIVPGEAEGVVYAGGDPGVLFESRDGGATFAVNRAFWEHPSRPGWQPGAGGLCLHSIATWPGDPNRLAVAVSAAGVWLTDDGGGTWRNGNEGIVARYLPDDAPADVVALCVHRIERAATRPDRLFMQFHGGVYRSDDAGQSWIDIADGLPSDFGFPLVLDPADADSAYVIPLTADVDRVTPNGRVRVYETRDAGATWARARRWAPERARLPHRAAGGVRPGRRGRRPSSSTSAPRRAPSSAPATRERAGSRRQRSFRPSTQWRRTSPTPERDLDGDGGAAARRRVDLEAPVEGIDSVVESTEAAACRGIGPADAVVAHQHAQAFAFPRQADLRLAGLRILGDVRERLGGDEVSGGLHLRLEPLGGHPADLDRHRSTRCERLQRRLEAMIAEHRRVDAAGELAQLLDRKLDLLAGLGDQLCGMRGRGPDLRLGEFKRHSDTDQALLRTVVQVTLDPPPLGIGGGDDALPRVLEVAHPAPQRACTPGFGRLAGKTDRAHRSPD